MSRFADAIRFGTPGGRGTWYHPPLSTDPAAPVNAPYIARADWLWAEYPGVRLGVAGTGYAITQYHLFDRHQMQSWGVDGAWARNQIASGPISAWANNVTAGDVLSSADMETFRRLGNTGKRGYDVIFTEDLLPALSNDAEVATALANLRAVGTTLVHLISPRVTHAEQVADMLWHTMDQWAAIINNPNERILYPDLTEWTP